MQETIQLIAVLEAVQVILLTGLLWVGIIKR